MNNYELHERAQEMADTHSAYELARMLMKVQRDSGALSTGYTLVQEPDQLIRGSTTACDDQFAPDPNEVDA